jgi:two-component system sensor histidine kinase KdpD
LTNAINYSPAGEKIEVGFDFPESSNIEFFVIDKGPGVPPEHKKKIFEKYFQLENRSKGRTHNTGLGLAFCKMAVEAHKGKIGVSSGDMGGSRFSFTLPLKTKWNH